MMSPIVFYVSLGSLDLGVLVLYQMEAAEAPSTADLVDVGCDAEVAELTCRDRDIQVDT